MEKKYWADEMIIAQANIDDALEILSLQKLCYQSEAKIYNDYTIPPLIQTLEEIQSEFEEYFFLKALKDKRIIGSVRARMSVPDTCYIGRLIIHPDLQNQGIGTRLMDEIEIKFRECIRWELITGHNSQKNIKLYEKCGYHIYKAEKLTSQLSLIYFEKNNEKIE